MTSYSLSTPKSDASSASRSDGAKSTSTPAQSAGLPPIRAGHFLMMLGVMLATLLYVSLTPPMDSMSEAAAATPIQKTNLVFRDEANGGIAIWVDSVGVSGSANPTHLPQHRTKLLFEGEQGFLRGTLRALARDRMARNLSPDVPFELALLQDGRLCITDPLTHKSIDLQAFGPDNLAVFVQILNAVSARPTPSAMNPTTTAHNKEAQ